MRAARTPDPKPRAGGGRASARPGCLLVTGPEQGEWGSPAVPTSSTPSTGAFSLLREKFSRAPSPDMSPASLSMLEQLMTAQAQECVFEGLSSPAPAAPHDCPAQLQLAQEAAQVKAGGPCPRGALDKHPGLSSGPGQARDRGRGQNPQQRTPVSSCVLWPCLLLVSKAGGQSGPRVPSPQGTEGTDPGRGSAWDLGPAPGQRVPN